MQRTLPDFTTYRGLPTRGELRDWCEESPQTVVVLDDMIHLDTKSPDALHLFQTMVSHSNLTAFLLSQDLYPPGVYAKSILLNCQHVILFKNVRDNRQIITFGSQVFTGRFKFWMDAYAKAVRRPYGYILVDLTPHCPDDRRLRRRHDRLPALINIRVLNRGTSLQAPCPPKPDVRIVPEISLRGQFPAEKTPRWNNCKLSAKSS